jgi:hypothetical protein
MPPGFDRIKQVLDGVGTAVKASADPDQDLRWAGMIP